MLGLWSVWGQGSEAVGLHASRWRVHGGIVQLGHEAVGTPWASAKVSLWGSGLDRTLEEWVVGFHAEDAQVWGRVAVHVGASHEVEDRTHLTWWVQAAVSSWPEVRVRSNANHHTSGGFHVRMSWGQASWWVGRASGQWAQARHLQLRGKTASRTNVPHTWSWGGMVMDGQGVVGAYALVPRLDGRMWSPLPKSGTRMGMWVSRGTNHMRWTVHATWAPSQQETFRCAWRCRWEA